MINVELMSKLYLVVAHNLNKQGKQEMKTTDRKSPRTQTNSK